MQRSVSRVINLYQSSQDCPSFKTPSFPSQEPLRPVQFEMAGDPTERRQVKNLRDHVCSIYEEGRIRGCRYTGEREFKIGIEHLLVENLVGL